MYIYSYEITKIMNIGYHSSISKGLYSVALEVNKLKLSAIQIFSGNPRNYFPSVHTNENLKAFNELNIPKFVHMNYLLNLSNSIPVIPTSIAQNLKFCDDINASGLIIHMGSNSNKEDGLRLTYDNIKSARNKTKSLKTSILIETTAEGGYRLKLDDIDSFVKEFGKELNVAIVADSAHLYAAGYTAEQIVEYLDKNKNVVKCLHLNNPSPNVIFGRHKDQHDIPLFDESGKFSKIEIENFITISNLHSIPMIMENYDDENTHKMICEKYNEELI